MPNNIYRNSEGYYDPTAGAALAKCDRKEKSDRRKAIRISVYCLYLQQICRGYRKQCDSGTEILPIRR